MVVAVGCFAVVYLELTLRMSFNLQALNCINNKTKCMVTGYLRRIHDTADDNNNDIPPLISYLCLWYFYIASDKFAVSGKSIKIHEQGTVLTNDMRDTWAGGEDTCYGSHCIDTKYKNQIIRWVLELTKMRGYMVIGIDEYDAMNIDKCYGHRDVKTNYYGYNHNGYCYANNIVRGSDKQGKGFRTNDVIMLEFNVKERKLRYYKTYAKNFDRREILCTMTNIKTDDDEKYKFALTNNGFGAKVKLLHFEVEYC